MERPTEHTLPEGENSRKRWRPSVDRRLLLWAKELPITPLPSPEAREEALEVAQEVRKEALDILGGEDRFATQSSQGTLTIVNYHLPLLPPVKFMRFINRPEQLEKVLQEFFRTGNEDPLNEYTKLCEAYIDPVADEPAVVTGADLMIDLDSQEASFDTEPKAIFRSQGCVFYPDRVVSISSNLAHLRGSHQVIAYEGPRLEKHEADKDELTNWLQILKNSQ